MQYNEDLYNSSNYNIGVLTLALFESLSAADLDLNNPQILKTEILSLIDNLQKYFNGTIFNETLTPTDVILNQAQVSKLDILTLADARVATTLKSLLETMTLSEIRTMLFATNLNEFVLLIDNLSKFISNKRVDETLRLQDWLSVKKRPAGNIWSN